MLKILLNYLDNISEELLHSKENVIHIAPKSKKEIADLSVPEGENSLSSILVLTLQDCSLLLAINVFVQHSINSSKAEGYITLLENSFIHQYLSP